MKAQNSRVTRKQSPHRFERRINTAKSQASGPPLLLLIGISQTESTGRETEAFSQYRSPILVRLLNAITCASGLSPYPDGSAEETRTPIAQRSPTIDVTIQH